MAFDEPDRRHLYEAARAALGEPAASTLMSIIPPMEWADVATKRDLAALEERIGLRFEAPLHDELRQQANRFVAGLFTVAALNFAVAEAVARVG